MRSNVNTLMALKKTARKGNSGDALSTETKLL